MSYTGSVYWIVKNQLTILVVGRRLLRSLWAAIVYFVFMLLLLSSGVHIHCCGWMLWGPCIPFPWSHTFRGRSLWQKGPCELRCGQPRILNINSPQHRTTASSIVVKLVCSLSITLCDDVCGMVVKIRDLETLKKSNIEGHRSRHVLLSRVNWTWRFLTRHSPGDNDPLRGDVVEHPNDPLI